jgi:hypothetical protein
MPRGDDGLWARDPVSELFDGAARKLLARAYGRRGQWTETRLANPSPRHVAWAAGLGINLLGPDPAQTLSGSHQDARSVWGRAFVRAVFHQHRWYYRTNLGGLGEFRRLVPNQALALQVTVGRMQLPRGVVPAGRLVSVRVMPGGQAARRAVATLPDSRRIFRPDGTHGGASYDYTQESV